MSSRVIDLTAKLLQTERQRDELFRANLRLRDKLLELARNCNCDGTGCTQIDGRVEDCPECHDIREVLQSC